MDPKQITALAKLLRETGDKVLSSEFKLTLSGTFLRALNDSFTLIADQSESSPLNGFQVVKQNNAKSDVYRDLQLIHDFVQKTLLLCITQYPGDDNFEGSIDITKFHSLKRLEVQKVNIKQVIGIQNLRSQLEHLICVRCLNNVEDIITYCGKDNSSGFVWNELRIADFSYNNLISCENSLEFARYLQHLNLSHNQLVSVQAIKWLPNLKVLNLSFNRLTVVPNLHIEASRKLQILLLSNNFIEDLNGIPRLDALTDLDLSDNCLLDHSYLLPLSTLIALRYLNLHGNPLYCHPKHREATTNYLHKNTSSVNFILDFEALSKSEKLKTGKYQRFSPASWPRNDIFQRSSGTSISSRRSDNGNTPASSVGSIQSFRFDQGNENASAVARKPVKCRNAEIEEKHIVGDEEVEKLSSKKTLKKSKNNLFVNLNDNKEHLETKKQIEQLRNKYGSDWLQIQNSDEVQSVLGIKTEDEEKKKQKITSQQLLSEVLNSLNISATSQESYDPNNMNLTSTPINVSPTLNFIAGSPIKAELNNSIKDTTSNDTNNQDTVYESANDRTTTSVDNETAYQTVRDETIPPVDELYSVMSNPDEQEVSEPEENEITYIVYAKDNIDELLLTVSDISIKEKDALTRKTRTKWSLKILESCDRITSNTLRINFDTVKKDKKERVYKVEEGLCQELEKYLRDILSKRQLSEMNQTIYRCVQCSCQFSRENTNDYKRNTRTLACPECKSKFVAEVIESPKPISTTPILEKPAQSSIIQQPSNSSKSNISDLKPSTSRSTSSGQTKEDSPNNIQGVQSSQGEKCLIEESASHSSIGKGVGWKLSNKILSSAGSLNESSSCSKISNSQSSFDSNQSVAGSSSNERDNDFNNMSGNGKYYDSDVEILSNPSQSSIEVLDGFQSSRKTSEERRISRIPSLETIEDNSIRNFSFKMIDDGQIMINSATDNNKTLTSKDSSAEFLKKEIKQTLKDANKDNLKDIEKIGSSSSSSSEKKINLGHINLTESSSSGSVTDSVCTTYEQDDKIIDSNLEDGPGNNKDKDSFMSSVLGGLFQSTNILMSRTQKSTDNDLSIPCDKFKYNFTDFSDIDHRIKLYFYQTKFNDQNEHFKWLVKGKIFNENTLQYFEGIVIMSTIKIYIMEIIGQETDNISKWLKEFYSSSVYKIESSQLLPFKIGLSFKIKNWGSFLLILQDILRTDSLLLFFADNPLPINCTLEYQISEKVLKKLSYSAEDEKLKMFSILNICEISCENDLKSFSPTGLFTTDNRLYLTTSNLSWLSDNSDNNIELGLTQVMSNLVEVDRPSNNILAINFLDETNDRCELWKCSFETQENAESCLSAIGQSWEKLFGVPLISN